LIQAHRTAANAALTMMWIWRIMAATAACEPPQAMLTSRTSLSNRSTGLRSRLIDRERYEARDIALSGG
jgi:hypothetical protein